MDRSLLLNRRKRFKAQAAFGNIQNRASVVLLQLQENKLVRNLSGLFATFHNDVSQGHVSLEAGLIFGTPFSGGREGCRICGPGDGAKPDLPASRRAFYAAALGLKLRTLTRAFGGVLFADSWVTFADESRGTE